jgi:amino acid transporter
MSTKPHSNQVDSKFVAPVVRTWLIDVVASISILLLSVGLGVALHSFVLGFGAVIVLSVAFLAIARLRRPGRPATEERREQGRRKDAPAHTHP